MRSALARLFFLLVFVGSFSGGFVQAQTPDPVPAPAEEGLVAAGFRFFKANVIDLGAMARDVANGIKQAIQDILDGLWHMIAATIRWLLQYMANWFMGWGAPYLRMLLMLLPTPEAVGYQYVFEAYQFMGKWYHFGALATVFHIVVTLHFLTLTIRIFYWCFFWGRRVLGLIPGMGS
jgi:hypothetical protein